MQIQPRGRNRRRSKRKTQGSREMSSAWHFCNTSWFVGALAKDGLFRELRSFT
jgi:hypothetical protein